MKKFKNGDLVGCSDCGNPYEYHYLVGCTVCKAKTNGESKISNDFLINRFQKKSS
jgi:hypothetical protein